METDIFRSLNISSLKEEEEYLSYEAEDGDEEDSEDDEKEVHVDLGFALKPKNPNFLLRQFFPSKAGGVPAWLDPINLPSGDACVCDFCRSPLQFVMQVYAPIVDKEATFHRAVFLFMCQSMSCLLQDQHEQWKCRPDKQSRSVKVFRSQLPRLNPYYSSEPPKDDGSVKPCTDGAALCCWCGTWKGVKVCGACRVACYCSEKHQSLHWGLQHKMECVHKFSRMAEILQSKVSSNSLWPEHEIVCEEECAATKSKNDCTMSPVGDRTLKVLNLLDENETDDDKRSWASFQERISKAPSQVLRYCRDIKATPIWPASCSKPSVSNIPSCTYCGAERTFEFQRMTKILWTGQLLQFTHVPGLVRKQLVTGKSSLGSNSNLVCSVHIGRPYSLKLSCFLVQFLGVFVSRNKLFIGFLSYLKSRLRHL